MRFHGYAPGAGRGPRRHALWGIAAVLAFGICAGSAPAHATGESPTPAVTTEAATAPARGAEGLGEAVARDVGMTLEEFNAAGAQAKRAADALAVLRDLRGFVAVRLQDGRIRVEGSGPELEDGVAALNKASATGRDEFVLVGSAPDPAADRPAETSANPAPSEPAVRKPAAGTAAGGELQASSTEQLYRAYLREVGPVGLQAVAEANGTFIIRTGDVNSAETAGQADSQGGSRPGQAAGTAGTSPSDFVEKYGNVVLEQGVPLASEEDFFGGQGYRVDGGGVVCSAGFSAFSPAGEPLVLTAGHCADDGTAQRTEVTLPAGDPAGGAVAGSAVIGELGTFGFSQFGGPGNARIAGDLDNPGEPGKDIATVESIRRDLDLLPAATTWEDPADLGKNSVEIVGAAAPVVGQFVCRSGRTEGWSCGVVDEVGIYVVGGPSGEPEDLRSFRGFLSYSVQSAGGDSGGPWISGNYAVGTHSAGNPRSSLENYAVAATLQDSLQVLPGVELRLFLNKPVLTTPLPAGPIAEGQRIPGRIPALAGTSVPPGSSVRITIPGREPLVVPADAAGRWSFIAPASTPEFSAQAVNGFSVSAVSTFRSRAEPVAPAPAPPGPTQGASGEASGEDAPARSKPVRPATPAVLTPAPQPTVAAVQPEAVQAQAVQQKGQADSWSGPTAAAALADTGASGLLPAAGGAVVALIVGGLLLIAVRRRR